MLTEIECDDAIILVASHDIGGAVLHVLYQHTSSDIRNLPFVFNTSHIERGV